MHKIFFKRRILYLDSSKTHEEDAPSSLAPEVWVVHSHSELFWEPRKDFFQREANKWSHMGSSRVDLELWSSESELYLIRLMFISNYSPVADFLVICMYSFTNSEFFFNILALSLVLPIITVKLLHQCSVQEPHISWFRVYNKHIGWESSFWDMFLH